MVNLEQRLDRVFAALNSATRRAILHQLSDSDAVSISALAAPSPLSLPAIMKHLDVLEAARLITRTKTGRTMFVRLAPAPMADADAWLERYRRFWSAGLDRLAAYAEAQERAAAAPSQPARVKALRAPARKTRR